MIQPVIQNIVQLKMAKSNTEDKNNAVKSFKDVIGENLDIELCKTALFSQFKSSKKINNTVFTLNSLKDNTISEKNANPLTLSILQNMINNILKDIDKGNITAMDKNELQQFGTNLIKNLSINNLDLKEVSKKISQILENNFGIKIAPDDVLKGMKGNKLDKIKDDYDTKADMTLNNKAALISEVNSGKDSVLVTNMQTKAESTHLLVPYEESNIKNKENIKAKNNIDVEQIEDQKIIKNIKYVNQQRNFLQNDNQTMKDDSGVAEDNIIKIKNSQDKQSENKPHEDFKMSFENNQNISNDFSLKTTTNKVISNNKDVRLPDKDVDIINQIVKNINLSKTESTSILKIQLKPDFLGKVEINLQSNGGNLIANIITENEKVKHQIEANVGILNSQLEAKGIKIDNFNVSVDKNMQFASQYNGQNFKGEGNSQNSGNRSFMFTSYNDYFLENSVVSENINNFISDDHVDVMV
ncbi:flagellar hook-length control protein FliK [Aceticella autotrophica]|uniref:Flagellar hook-length control protein FliK n=1 Tax=Aceticella autotrophica TaxID=2755338 RepID=A0A974Y4C0_9THEO|nr:flagellar hook-length control protein FliK [Aceticella autotrophica]QSZ26607.1 flagellar hook-length control protein FliK [Aceticella autotrophica]